MSEPYPCVPLGEVLVQDTRYQDQPEPRLYPKLSVKLYGKGVVPDEPAHGAELKMKRHQLARRGQVIVSEIWAKKGAVGVVPPEGEGALCTSHFFLFDIQEDRADPDYVRWLFAANYLEPQLADEARGSTGYAAVRPRQFLQLEVPLPPLAEQRRVVARVEAVAEKVEAARRLLAAQEADAQALPRALLFQSAEQRPTPMRALLRQRPTEVEVSFSEEYRFAGVYSFGRGVFYSKTKRGSGFSYKRLTRLHANDLVYPKLMAWEGAFGVVPPECDGLVVSPEFPVFEVDQEQVLPEVLDVYFRTPAVWAEIEEISTGTNARRRRLHPSAFLDYEMPLPPMPVQHTIRSASAQVQAAREAWTATQEDLDALLPSVLDRAFRGAL